MIDLPHDLNTEDYSGAAAEDRKQIRMNRAGIRFARAPREWHLADRCCVSPLTACEVWTSAIVSARSHQ